MPTDLLHGFVKTLFPEEKTQVLGVLGEVRGGVCLLILSDQRSEVEQSLLAKVVAESGHDIATLPVH